MKSAIWMNLYYIYLYETEQKFYVRKTRGGGDCLFSSMACGLQRDDHLNLRREIVDHNISSEQNWSEYSFWAKHDFQIDTRLQYRLKLQHPGEYGTCLIECRAFSNLYKTNVNIVRLFDNEHYFIKNVVHSKKSSTIWLLFTGLDHSSGHFRLLVPIL